MSGRIPSRPLEDDLTLELESEIAKHYGSNPNFRWQDDTGIPIGPFAVIAYVMPNFPSPQERSPLLLPTPKYAYV